MESTKKRKPEGGPEASKSLRKKLVRSLRGKPKFLECIGEPMKVYLRVRPFTDAEMSSGESQACLEIENFASVLMHPPKDSFTFKHQTRNGSNAETVHRFSFSHVFGPETNQRSFFEDTSLNVVKDFIDGQNCLVFSYGVTNAGKTYTIHGSSQDMGILPRTLNVLFNSFQGRIYKRTNLKPKMFCDVVKLASAQECKEDSKKNVMLTMLDNATPVEDLDKHNTRSNNGNGDGLGDRDSILRHDSMNVIDLFVDDSAQFALWISFAEIYNEQIFDLLEPVPSEKEKKRTVLKLGDDKNGNPYIKGLRHILIGNADEAYKVLKIGQQNQRNASTKLNNNSSRSHCIFNLKVARLDVINGEPHVVKVSQLSFVDLAGSERYTKTQNTGERLKEAGNINTSIMTLGKCVELLRYNQNHPRNLKNIPFRESKLTRLFQVFFFGQGNVSMIVNVNQCASAFDETLHALKFSAIARKVATINIEPLCTEDLQKHDVEQLLSVVKTLQIKLADEAMKNAMMELKIREEVSQEMSEQMAEIENNYSERLMEEQHLNEEVLEKRIELLTNSIRKSRRRRPCTEIFEDREHEWVSSALLHHEQMKVKEKDQVIQCLQETIESQKKLIDELRQEMSVGSLVCVSLSRENSLEKSFEDVLHCSPQSPTQLSGNTALLSGEDGSKSSKRKILDKLEGLVESGSSISRSAKNLTRKVFNETPSPSSFSLQGGTSVKKDKKHEEIMSSKPDRDATKRKLRSWKT